MVHKQNQDTFIRSTALLAVSGVAVKILSAAYRIPLTRMIGAEGMGKYSAAFNIFMPFFSLAVAGITPTISRLAAMQKEDDSSAYISIKKKAAGVYGVLSVLLIAVAVVVSWFYSIHMESPMIFYWCCTSVSKSVFRHF